MDAFGYLTAEGIEFYGGFAKGGFGAFSIPLKIPTDDTIGRSRGKKIAEKPTMSAMDTNHVEPSATCI